jgi:hypothetical protein
VTATNSAGGSTLCFSHLDLVYHRTFISMEPP